MREYAPASEMELLFILRDRLERFLRLIKGDRRYCAPKFLIELPIKLSDKIVRC